MQRATNLKSGKRVTVLLVVMFLPPAMTVAYGKRSEMDSPTEKTGQKTLTVDMKSTAPGQQEVIGVVRISQRASGVVIEPALKGLKPGLHGFHIHEEDSYSDDPDPTGGSGNAIACGVAEDG